MSNMTSDKLSELLYIEQCEDCGGRGDWDTGLNYTDYMVCSSCEGTGIDSWAVEQNKIIREQNGGNDGR
jgi:DnaJ-class molecular chaperone